MPDDSQDTDLEALVSLLDNAVARPPEPRRVEAPRPIDPSPQDISLDPMAAMSAIGITQLRKVPDITKPWMKHHNFVLVKTAQEVNEIVDAAIASGVCSIDLESEGLDNRIFYRTDGKPFTKHKIVGYCISYGDAKTGYYIPVGHKVPDKDPNVKPLAEVEAAITRLCRAAQPVVKPGSEDMLGGRDWETPPKVVIHFWHAPFDQEFLYPITGIDYWHPESFEDGNLACFTINSGDHHLGLKAKAEEKLRDPEGNPYEMIELKELFLRGRDIEFQTIDPEEPGVLKYAGSDAICTLLLGLHKDILPVVKAKKYTGTYRLEKQVAQVKRVMERNRVKLDRARVDDLRNSHEALFNATKTRLIELASSKGVRNFDPGSPKQLGDFLFGETGLNIEPKPERTATGQFKTDWDTLDALIKDMGGNVSPVFQWVIDYREEEKLLGTYLKSMSENLDERDEMRFQFKQTGTMTGRFSAPAGDPDHGYSGIPIHGIPSTSDLRTCFIAREGYTMVKCDYAGQELRIVTNLSHEPVWIKEFNEGSGDLHSITARAFFNKQDVTKDERKAGKVSNFALIYGGGPQAIMRATGCDKIEGARRKAAFDKSVPTFAKWVKEQHARVKKDLGVWTAFQRWISIPDAAITPGGTDSNGRRVDEGTAKMIRASCERQAGNAPIQGSGADIMKISMILCHKAFYKKGWLKNGTDTVRMLLTVHDELVCEIRNEFVTEAIPIIVDAMEYPTKLASKPVWLVPLITEPLVGPTWGTGYPCERQKPGHKFQEGEKAIAGYIYSHLRVVDMNKDGTPKDKLVAGEVIHKVDIERKKVTIRYDLAKWLDYAPEPPVPLVPSPEGSLLPTSATLETPPPLAPAAPTVLEVAPKKNGLLRTVTLRLTVLTRRSLGQVKGACAQFQDPDHGDLLQIVDPRSKDKILVDCKLGIKVNSKALADELARLNISDGRVGYSNDIAH